MTYALEVLLAALSLFGVALIIDGVCANRADESRKLDSSRENLRRVLATTPVLDYGRGPASPSPAARRSAVDAQRGISLLLGDSEWADARRVASPRVRPARKYAPGLVGR